MPGMAFVNLRLRINYADTIQLCVSKIQAREEKPTGPFLKKTRPPPKFHYKQNLWLQKDSSFGSEKLVFQIEEILINDSFMVYLNFIERWNKKSNAQTHKKSQNVDGNKEYTHRHVRTQVTKEKKHCCVSERRLSQAQGFGFIQTQFKKADRSASSAQRGYVSLGEPGMPFKCFFFMVFHVR